MTPPLNLPPVLVANLRALARVDHSLAARLCLPVSNDHLVGKPVRLRQHRSTFRLKLTDDEVEAATTGLSGRVRVVGIGLGEQVEACLQQGCDVLAWDRDPALVRAALTRWDWSRAIILGQLKISMGIDLLSFVDLPTDHTLIHPLLGQVYHLDLRLLAHKPNEKRALLCAGGLFVDDVAEALNEAGYSVYVWDIHRLSEGELDRVVARFDPDVVVAINHTHGLAEACHRLGRPLLVWEIDPATDSLRSCATPTDHVSIFTYRAANITRFEQAGFSAVRALPLAANIARRRPLTAPDSHESNPPTVCFVGASMVDQAQCFRTQLLAVFVALNPELADAHAVGAAQLETILSKQRQRPDAYVIPELLSRLWPEFVATARDRLCHDPVAMVAEMAAAERRLNIIGGLGKLGVRVWGDEGWRGVAHLGAKYMGFAGHDRELTAIYQTETVHVDVGRLYQTDIVPMRVFDILACGGFLIAEHSEALLTLFEPGIHLETWRTPAELQSKVRYFLAHPAEAGNIAAQGLARVRAKHTIPQRVRTMLAAVATPHNRLRSSG